MISLNRLLIKGYFIFLIKHSYPLIFPLLYVLNLSKFDNYYHKTLKFTLVGIDLFENLS